jgi:FAD-dependent urate hydroxylase
VREQTHMVESVGQAGFTPGRLRDRSARVPPRAGARSGRVDAVVIGAGPYGLASAAHLSARGLAVRTFGEPMESWRERMPAGMFLKSTPGASSISAPCAGSTLAGFCAATGDEPLVGHRPVPIDSFIRYGLWFMERHVSAVERVAVARVAQAGSGFSVALENGQEFAAESVIVASGLNGVAHLPNELARLHGGRAMSVERGQARAEAPAVSHSSEHPDLSGFAGRRVAVIGAGQSALENAALLHEHGATVDVFVRGAQVLFAGAPTDVSRQGRGTVFKPESPLGPGWSHVAFSRAPGGFRHLPVRTRLWLVANILGPFGAWWLRERVEGCVPVHLEHRLERATYAGDHVVLGFATPEGPRAREFDHVMAATGYRVDVQRLEFLDGELRRQIARTAGTWPALDGSFSSSVAGLYFTGLAAAATFGPLMRFVCGTGFAARRLTMAVSRRRATVA